MPCASLSGTPFGTTFSCFLAAGVTDDESVLGRVPYIPPFEPFDEL